MKTAQLRKKVGRLLERADEQDRQLACSILGVDPKKNPNLEGCSKEALEEAAEILEKYAGSPGNQSSSLSMEEQLEKLWDERLEKVAPDIPPERRQDLEFAKALTRRSNYSYWEQGSVRPHSELSRWDVLSYLNPSPKWDPIAGLIAGITEEIFRLELMREETGLQNLSLEDLKAADALHAHMEKKPEYLQRLFGQYLAAALFGFRAVQMFLLGIGPEKSEALIALVLELKIKGLF